MPRVGFEPIIAASKRAKTVHALDHSATATGLTTITYNNYRNAINITLNQLTLSRYKTALGEVSPELY
jgi:hypothetical protein